MRVYTQRTFAAPADLEALQDEPLTIHSQDMTPTGGRSIALLIHGLGGERYSYWERLPEFLFDDVRSLDVGMYDYATGIRRHRGNSIELEDEGEILAGMLRKLRGEYRSIVLIGHSMGGLLAKAAIASLIQQRDKLTLRRITGLMLLASPQLGSLRVPTFLRFVSRDARALSPHNRYLRSIDKLFSGRIKSNAQADRSRPYNIPTWALYAPNDFWVDVTSAGIGLSPDQKLAVRGDHGSIVRPRRRDDDAYQFIKSRVADAVAPQPELASRTTEVVCRDATVGDLAGIADLGVRMFGAESTQTMDELFYELVHRFPGTIRLVWRVTEVPGERRQRLLGYSAVFPLSQSAAEMIKGGLRTIRQLAVSQLVDSTASSTVLYIGAVAALDVTSKALALEALAGQVQRLSAYGVSEILARPVTADGLRLVRQHGFRPVSGAADMGALFCRSAV